MVHISQSVSHCMAGPWRKFPVCHNDGVRNKGESHAKKLQASMRESESGLFALARKSFSNPSCPPPPPPPHPSSLSANPSFLFSPPTSSHISRLAARSRLWTIYDVRPTAPAPSVSSFPSFPPRSLARSLVLAKRRFATISYADRQTLT